MLLMITYIRLSVFLSKIITCLLNLTVVWSLEFVFSFDELAGSLFVQGHNVSPEWSWGLRLTFVPYCTTSHEVMLSLVPSKLGGQTYKRLRMNRRTFWSMPKCIVLLAFLSGGRVWRSYLYHWAPPQVPPLVWVTQVEKQAPYAPIFWVTSLVLT